MPALSQHSTLVASTVLTVTLTGDYYREVEIVNRDGAAEVYFTIDGTTPVVAANDTYVLPAVIGGLRVKVPKAAPDTVVKLISSGTPKVSVTGL